MSTKVKNILLIHPRFAADRFMGHYDTPCELVGAKQPMPPLGLLTVAAMLPTNWDLRLIDRNIADLTEADLIWADLIMAGGMLSQQQDLLHLIDLCHARGKQIAVGGSDPTSSPHVYGSADFLLVGEAEGMIDKLISAWLAGEKNGCFRAEKFTADMTASPVPRFDLIETDDYLQVGIQFSRGCPFTCEFCDIIELYGRVPRIKTNDQIIAEIDALYRQGYRGIIYFVDDNFIGNRKAVRALLPKFREWQEKRRFPFQFYTAATLNIADDSELLDELRCANFFSIFIGIESADADVLTLMKKKQNTRRDIAENVRKIQRAGLFVTAGFVIGFDNEGDHLVDPLIQLIEQGPIAICMVGLLYALPNTQLSRRLKAENRLLNDQRIELFEGSSGSCVTGLNFATKRPRAEILSDFRKILAHLYDRKNYFDRVHRSAMILNNRSVFGSSDLRSIWQDLRRWALFTWNIHRKHPELISGFWLCVGKCLMAKPGSLKAALLMIAMYTHLGAFAERAVKEIEDMLAAGQDCSRAPDHTSQLDDRHRDTAVINRVLLAQNNDAQPTIAATKM
jgi:radical SAM superfamily enzyme YgiQ (UPF0313 family)